MRTVNSHLLEDKMDEAVTHYINSHHPSEPVHIDSNGIPMTVQDDGGGRVTIMHQQTYTTQMCRQVSVTEQVGEGPWGEELLEGPIAAIVAHLQNSRHHPSSHHKMAQVRSDAVDSSVILDGTMRFNGPSLDQQSEPIVVQLPPMQTLPPLQDMKRCDADWFGDKNKKDDGAMLQESDSQVLEMASSSPAQHKHQSRKSLPHKKRISRKLKRNNGNTTPQQEQLVVINCSEAVPVQTEQEQILPDNYVAVPHAAHIPHEVRPVLICQECGEYYGEEQLKFYQHLKGHYEPQHTIIIENPVPDLPMDKISNNCIVDNVATLPDSIVELSLENTVPKTLYQPIEKHILYSTTDKTLSYNTNKVQYSMASMDGAAPTVDTDKTYRKQRHEPHVRDSHANNTKLEDMGEFSEPEDLMAGIQVCVPDTAYEPTILPHLTVDNGHVHQDHTRHWYSRGSNPGTGGAGAGNPPCDEYCGVCAREPDTQYKLLKEEVLQRILDHEVSDNANFADNMLPDHEVNDNDHDQDDRNDHNDHGQTHNDHGHSQNDHGHSQTEQNHGQNDHSIGDNESNRHNENHTQNHIQNEHTDSLRHSEHSQHSHGHNENDLDHNEQSHGQQSQDHGDHWQIHSGHGQDHNEHSRDHSESSQDQNQDHFQILKQEQEGNATSKEGKRFKCKKCDRVFSHRNSLIYHLLSHEGKQHKCPHCDKGFYTISALKIHIRTHSNDRPYKCELCGRNFRQWSDLKYHTNSLHSDKKLFKCEYCGKEFARKYSLTLHVKIHTGEKNYKCELCNKSFRCSSYKIAHMRTHTDDRPFKCDVCEKGFRSTFDLRRHFAIHGKRNKFDEHKPKAKDKAKIKILDTKEEKVEKEEVQDKFEILEPSPKKAKHLALASTTRQAVFMKKMQKSKKTKKGAPNVTVQNRDGFFKNDELSNVEVYDGRLEYAKMKHVYCESDKIPIIFKEEQNRELSILRPLSVHRAEVAEEKAPYRGENTDGKMQVFTQLEKEKDYNGHIVANSQVLGDIRHLEREVAREMRSDIPGEGMGETGFIERLTAIYSIPTGTM